MKEKIKGYVDVLVLGLVWGASCMLGFELYGMAREKLEERKFRKDNE